MKTSEAVAYLGLTRAKFISLAEKNGVTPKTAGSRGISAVWDKKQVEKLKKLVSAAA